MIYLHTQVLGPWFYLYLILDLYSRKIVGWEVHATDDSDHAAHLVRRTALAEGIASMLAKPVKHDDNGATLKATTGLSMLYWLGIKPSYSRPGSATTTATPSHCCAPPSTARSTLPKALLPWTMHEPGPPNSCAGTRSSTTTAASARSVRQRVMTDMTSPSWPPATRCIKRPANAIQHTGQAA